MIEINGSAGARGRVFGQGRQFFAAVPGVANDSAEDIAFPLEHGERLEEFALVQQEPLVADAGVDHLLDALAHGVDRIAHREDHAFAGAHAAEHAFAGPIGIGDVEDGADASGRCALARLGCLPDQDDEQIGEMAIVLNLVIRPAADGVAEADEILQQQGSRIAFGVRRQARHHFAGEAVIGGRRHHRPGCRVVIAAIALAGCSGSSGISSKPSLQSMPALMTWLATSPGRHH